MAIDWEEEITLLRGALWRINEKTRELESHLSPRSTRYPVQFFTLAEITAALNAESQSGKISCDFPVVCDCRFCHTQPTINKE